MISGEPVRRIISALERLQMLDPPLNASPIITTGEWCSLLHSAGHLLSVSQRVLGRPEGLVCSWLSSVLCHVLHAPHMSAMVFSASLDP